MKYSALTLTLGLISCGATKGERQETAEPLTNSRVVELRQVFDEKMTELQTLVDADGYPVGRDDCDLTLWAGEAQYAGAKVNLDLVEHAPGVIGRRPTPCWTEEEGDLGAPSSTSNDMLTGYMLGRWAEKNLGAFERLAAYGEDHKVYFPIPGWVMGEPYPEMATRVVLRPNGIGIVGRALYALTDGRDDRSYRKWISLYGGGEGYEQHVQTVGILTDGLVAEAARKGFLDVKPTEDPPKGKDLLDVTMNELEALRYFREQNPENYFFQAVYARYSGDTSQAVDLLLNPATPVPGYVRGSHQRAYELIHWLAAAKVILDLYPVTD